MYGNFFSTKQADTKGAREKNCSRVENKVEAEN